MSSKRRIRRRSCEGKKQYATYEEALKSALAVSDDLKETVSAYECEFGKHFHIGHPSKRRLQSKQAKSKNIRQRLRFERALENFEKGEGMRIWLDDQWDSSGAPERWPPPGFIPVKNWAELKKLLDTTRGRIKTIDFDHDLADFAEDGQERHGYWIIKKLAEDYLGRYPEEVRVHSRNTGGGAQNILSYDRNVRKHLLSGL